MPNVTPTFAIAKTPMYTFNRRQRRTTAITLLVIFLHVLVGQLVCVAWGNPPPRPLRATPAHHHPPDAATPAHRHAHAPGTAAHHHQHKPERHPHDPAASCCQDDAAAIWASLHTPPKFLAEKSWAPLLLSLPPAFSWVPARFRAWDLTLAVRLVPGRHLPPKIPDLRVFLRSLTV